MPTYNHNIEVLLLDIVPEPYPQSVLVHESHGGGSGRAYHSWIYCSEANIEQLVEYFSHDISLEPDNLIANAYRGTHNYNLFWLFTPFLALDARPPSVQLFINDEGHCETGVTYQITTDWYRS